MHSKTFYRIYCVHGCHGRNWHDALHAHTLKLSQLNHIENRPFSEFYQFRQSINSFYNSNAKATLHGFSKSFHTRMDLSMTNHSQNMDTHTQSELLLKHLLFRRRNRRNINQLLEYIQTVKESKLNQESETCQTNSVFNHLKKDTIGNDSDYNKNDVKLRKANISIQRTSILRGAISRFIQYCRKENKETTPDSDNTEIGVEQVPSKLYWNNPQRDTLQNLLNLKSRREISYYITRINLILRRYHQLIPISEEKLEVIDEWMKENDYRYPKFLEFENLRLKTGLTDVQLRYQLKKRVNAMHGSSLRNSTKRFLKQYMMQNNYELPSSEERDDLQSKLSISRYQLNYYLHYLKEHKSKISNEAVDLVKKWIHNHPPNSKPSKSERMQLCKEAGISSSQLTNLLIAHAIRGTISDESKQKLINWLKEHDRRPNTKERKDLREKLQWNSSQLNRYIRVYFDSKNCGQITKKKKKRFEEWIQENNSPTIEQKNEIQAELSLSRSQVNSLISSYRNKLIKGQQNESLNVSDEIKGYIAEWLKNNEYQLPNNEERNKLSQKLNIAKSQLGKLFRNAQSKVPLYLLSKK